MNEILGRKAIEAIKLRWGLPSRGFIAGGSIANIIWELVSGNKAVVNDVDVFIFDEHIDKLNKYDGDTLFNYQEKGVEYYDGYGGVQYESKVKDFYTISRTEMNDIFNSVYYKSNTTDPSLILKSFDINCTKVGYSIEQDKFYWTKEFEDFLKTGDLKMCNLLTPSHSAIRIVKKSKELNANLDPFELRLLEYVLSRRFSDVLKVRFKERYVNLYEQNKDTLGEIFNIKRDKEIEDYLMMQFQVKTNLWFLEPINGFDLSESILEKKISFFDDDDNIDYIPRSIDFLFYMRNVFGNKELILAWKSLRYFWHDEDYIDIDINVEDINLLSRFAMFAPGSIGNLLGMKLSEQIIFVKRFLDKFKDDPIIAISILESVKMDKDIELDDQTLLLLELVVRKKIVSDDNGKVRNILQIGEIHEKVGF